MSETVQIVAPPEAAGARADRYLAEASGVLSRSRVKTLIEAGRATRDGTVFTQPAEPIRAGSAYVLTQPDPVSAIPLPQRIPFEILYEDRELIVLDKPAGLVVHPAPGNQDGTLVNALLAHCGDTLPGIGGEIEGAIGRDPRDRKRMAIVSRGGKPALTRYRLERVFHASVSLLECRLATGRTHQIRVHLSAGGHPVVGDPVYLRRIPAISRAVPEPARSLLLDFPRQALHAATLGFRHPSTGAEMRFSTPLPTDFQALLGKLA